MHQVKNPFLLLLFFVLLTAQSLKAQPSETEKIGSYAVLSLAVATELFFKESLAPKTARWQKVNPFDHTFRNVLKWENSSLNHAALYSDVIAMGILLPTMVVAPLVTDYKSSHYWLVNAQVLGATAITTVLAKFLVGRQRPYAQFNTSPSLGGDDNLSFFSGHTSFSFAAAVSQSYLLQKQFPKSAALIWSSSLTLAALVAYFRVAADKHYISDVIVGAIVGSAVAWSISAGQYKRLLKGKKYRPTVQIKINIPL